MSGSEMPSHHGPEVVPEGEYPNDTVRMLLERGSCRDFSGREIPMEVLRTVLEAGTHAPTGGNLQPYSIIKIKDEETRRWFAEHCGQRFVGEAPVLLLFCIDWRRIERWASLEVAPFTAPSSFRHFWISFQDTVMCAQNICMAADAMGLGSCYIGTVLEFFQELRDRFKLPKRVFPVVLLCMGYPARTILPRKKLGVNVVVHDEMYRETGDDELLEAFNEKYTGRGSRRIEVSEDRLDTISEVCREVHSGRFAERCLQKIKENGYISTVQRYFGLHYRADKMPKDNPEYLRLMENSGFDWFNEFKLVKK